jgi:hypothetical protein
MKSFWKQGRQYSGYFTLKLFSFWKIDLYVIKCLPNQKIRAHTDKVDGKKHFRANLLLSGEDTFWMQGNPLLKLGKLTVFRPDIFIHGAEESEKPWYILSFGWVREK